MTDENDDGARVGLWVAIGIITLLLFGLIGGLAIRAQHAKKPAAKPPVAAASAAMAEEALLDAPLAGEVIGKLFFESGKADLPADAAPSHQHHVVGQVLRLGRLGEFRQRIGGRVEPLARRGKPREDSFQRADQAEHQRIERDGDQRARQEQVIALLGQQAQGHAQAG
ncbi:MAG: hypothetical protein CFE45_40755, partial [Burkholderiales bacterium PBB5]